MRFIANRWFLIEQPIQAISTGQSGLNAGIQSGKPLHRIVSHQQRSDEREECSRCRSAFNHAQAAVNDNDKDGDTAQELHNRSCHGLDARGLHVEDPNGFHVVGNAVRLIALHSVCLDHSDALKGLIENRQE